MAALQAGIARALDKGNADNGDATVTADPATVLASAEGNHVCADCSKPEVEWASVNLGILLCIECSGIHRGLGVHFSKVRSVLLDRWTPEMLLHMCRVGNARANRRYEATLADNPAYAKPTRSTPKAEKERFTRAKYCDQLFMDESVPLKADLDDLGITDDSGTWKRVC
jgi:ribosomal protein L37AE/L43A